MYICFNNLKMTTEDSALVTGAEWLYWSLILTICQVTYLVEGKI